MPALVKFFIEKKALEINLGTIPGLAEGAMDRLMGYRWPGNVRELENVIERSMILSHDGKLAFEELAILQADRNPHLPSAGSDEPIVLDAVIAGHISKVLAMSGGKIHGPGGAAELLGINPNTLRYRMGKLGIQFRKQTR